VIERVDALIAQGGKYAPRWGWHDDHRAADGTPDYLPALQQVRSEFSTFLDALGTAGVLNGGRCLQLGLGECEASHDVWSSLFPRGAVTIDWAGFLVGGIRIAGGDTHGAEALAFARERAPYDMLFVDAGHLLPDVTADHRDYGELVRPGGVVAFHDALERQGHNVEVWRYVRELPGVEVIGTEVGIAWVLK
jgi:hypothetical protein